MTSAPRRTRFASTSATCAASSTRRAPARCCTPCAAWATSCASHDACARASRRRPGWRWRWPSRRRPLAVYLGVRGELRGEVDDSLRERAETIVDRGRRGPGRPEHPADAGFGPPGEPSRGLRARPRRSRFGGPRASCSSCCPGGRACASPDERERLPVDDARPCDRARGSGEDLTDIDGRRHSPARAHRGPRPGAARSRWPGRSTRSTASSTTSLLVLLVVGAVRRGARAPPWARLVARTALAPIARFTSRTEELAADPDPSERMEVVGRDELTRLARSFNTTLDALERSVEAQRHLVADASHELRTPIASLRANIQTLEDADRLPPDEREALRADIVEELDELTALVADIVELARGAKPARRRGRRAARPAGGGRGRARQRRGRATTSASRADAEPTLVRGDPERIHRASPTCVDNARKWSPPGGEVEVACAAASSPCATTARASPTATCSACSSASTAPRTPAACPGRGWAWRSCARRPRRTAARWRRRTRRAEARCCASLRARSAGSRGRRAT